MCVLHARSNLSTLAPIRFPCGLQISLDCLLIINRRADKSLLCLLQHLLTSQSAQLINHSARIHLRTDQFDVSKLDVNYFANNNYQTYKWCCVFVICLWRGKIWLMIFSTEAGKIYFNQLRIKSQVFTFGENSLNKNRS